MHTVADLMLRFAVKDTTVLGWIKSGELKAVNVGRAPGLKKPQWRISAESLAEFERSRTPHAAPQPSPPKRKQRKAAADVIRFY